MTTAPATALRKIIFLDFDGVLNSTDWWDKRIPYEQVMLGFMPPEEWIAKNPDKMCPYPIEDWDLCPDNIAQLNRLVEATGAEVVVSSTWRMGRTVENLRDILHRNGFKGTVTDVTPSRYETSKGGILQGVLRGNEIQLWIDENCQGQDIAFVILDDDADMVHLMGRLVKTNPFEGGLCVHHVEAAIQKLNEQWKPQEEAPINP